MSLKEQYNDLLEANEKFLKGWGHFCDCINWGKSFLDAEAIQFMNEVPGFIQTAVKKIKED